LPERAAKLPEPVADAKPPEPAVESSPAEEAAKNALRQRLKEMEVAESLQQQRQQPPQAPQQQQPEMPAHVQKWLSEHPQYMDPDDQISQAEINLATMKCVRDGLNWNDDDFLPSIERHLGIAPRTNGYAESKPTPQPTNHTPPRPAVSQRPPAARPSAVPVSAPPTREVPSMRTGRPQGGPVRLTAEQVEMAHNSGITVEEYARQLEKMERMKRAGEIQG